MRFRVRVGLFSLDAVLCIGVAFQSHRRRHRRPPSCKRQRSRSRFRSTRDHDGQAPERTAVFHPDDEAAGEAGRTAAGRRCRIVRRRRRSAGSGALRRAHGF